MIELAPFAAEAELTDPAMVGDWLPAFEALVRQPQVAPWCNYVARRDGTPVGVGAFKTPPQDGSVEIAYLTFLPFEGQGVATAVAAKLVDLATGEDVRQCIAHTLPEADPSTKVLAANGFHLMGTIEDPDDGPVWRWERSA